jgi:hypothetical protein
LRRMARPIAIRCFCPAGESSAALGNQRLVAFRQSPDELICVRLARSRLNRFIGRIRAPEPDVLAHRTAEQQRVLSIVPRRRPPCLPHSLGSPGWAAFRQSLRHSGP